jgi:hypothetical protein
MNTMQLTALRPGSSVGRKPCPRARMKKFISQAANSSVALPNSSRALLPQSWMGAA